MKPYVANMLPLESSQIDISFFLNELINATSKLEVYKTKIEDSKLANEWFLPTLQQTEALKSSLLEGTQATLDGVLVNQVIPDEKDKDLTEVFNYYKATGEGYSYLRNNVFSIDFINSIHKTLMSGNIRRTSDRIGAFRIEQNYIGKIKGRQELTFIPPEHEHVEELMENLTAYIDNPNDNLQPLIRAAIIHAQFLTIHPYMDGNGRVGRMLIPMYLYSCKQIDLPCFFVSEALERDKFRYYKLLNDIRFEGKWNEWIKFFLSIISAQCEKYIGIVTDINQLYEKDLEKAKKLVRSSKIVDVISLLYKYPVITAVMLAKEASIPTTSANRYLNILSENEMIYQDDSKSRNRTFYYYDLLNILR